MKNYIGVDVGKNELYLSVKDEDVVSIPNNSNEIKKWIERNELPSDAIWVYEPTGGYEQTLKHVLLELSLPQCCVHANHIRYYAKARGIAAKTDKIDAKIIQGYAKDFDVEARNIKEDNPILRGLSIRREQLIKMRRIEKNQREHGADVSIKKMIDAHIKQLTDQLEEVEELIESEIAKDDALSKQRDLYESVPSIGRTTANHLVVYLPELLTHDANSLSALVGVAPMNRDSGGYQGKRKTVGGRSRVRGALYMAVISAIRCNPEIARFYERLKSKGKPAKVALIAAMRKLLTILRSIAVRQTPWVDEIQPKIA